jgi:hypothetical protein
MLKEKKSSAARILASSPDITSHVAHFSVKNKCKKKTINETTLTERKRKGEKNQHTHTRKEGTKKGLLLFQ